MNIITSLCYVKVFERLAGMKYNRLVLYFSFFKQSFVKVLNISNILYRKMKTMKTKGDDSSFKGKLYILEI